MYIEKIVKRSSKFTFEDIANTLFHNKCPQVVIKPFTHIKDSIINKISFSVELSIFKENLNILEILASSIVGNSKNNFEYLSKLPDWIVLLIQKYYKEELNNWIDYLFDNINEFCEKNSESLINSNVLDKGGIALLFPDKLTFEQKLWISVHFKIDKNEMIKFVTEIRDSLLPWLNTDLYNKVKDKQENTRTNVAYESQRRKMLEGNLDDLDIVK